MKEGLKRRDVLVAAGGLLLPQAIAAVFSSPGYATPAPPRSAPTIAPPPSEELWKELDASLRASWDAQLHRATEAEIRADSSRQLLYLPWPYVTPSGDGATFREMFCWDSYFINRALWAHGRVNLVRNHILNYLSLVERFGYMPNANHAAATSRSQTPVFPDSIWRYYAHSGDRDLLQQAYPLLKREYRQYWNATHHQTPIGLATNRDLGDARLPPELAAEAETGLDWTPIYGGDVRRCVPLITNCALVRYARVLALMGKALGLTTESSGFAKQAASRAALIREYCWNERLGLFVEYDYVAAKQLLYVSACAYWTLWAGVATRRQAQRLVANLPRLEQPHGLASTDQAYPDQRASGAYRSLAAADGMATVAPDVPPETVGGRGELQWMYPTGWAPEHLITVQGLDAYGYSEEATRIAARFLTLVIDQYQRTGRLWEKYNVVDGSLVLPNSRYGNVPMRGWTAAAVALLGRRLFGNELLQAA